jgi:hypothetical protein
VPIQGLFFSILAPYYISFQSCVHISGLYDDNVALLNFEAPGDKQICEERTCELGGLGVWSCCSLQMDEDGRVKAMRYSSINECMVLTGPKYSCMPSWWSTIDVFYSMEIYVYQI